MPRRFSVAGRFEMPLSDKPAKRIEQLRQAGRIREAQETAKQALSATPEDAALWAALAATENSRRDFKEARNAIERARSIAPEVQRYRVIEAQIANNSEDYSHSIPLYEALRADLAADLRILNGLKVGYYATGRKAEATALGAEILAERDRNCMAKADPAALAFEPSPPSSRNRRRIIAFSLWGKAPHYLAGAMANLRLARLIMPGWRCRFYVGADVPEAVLADLKAQGAELIEGAKAHPDIPSYCWRFLVADEPGLEAFLCRDCDSRLSAKEWAAVEDWLASGRTFHVMRDHVIHSELILAGLWGGRGGSGLEMGRRIREAFGPRQKNDYGSDQGFLARVVWPAIRRHTLAHDSYYDLGDSRRFPIGKPGSTGSHVGQAVLTTAQLQREAELFGLPWPIPGASPAENKGARLVARMRPSFRSPKLK